MGLLGKKKEIGPDTLIQRRNDLLFNEIDGEVVMLSIKNSKYFGMNKVGSRIWELLEKPLKFQDLILELMLEYDIDKKYCEEDALHFIYKLKDQKLVETK